MGQREHRLCDRCVGTGEDPYRPELPCVSCHGKGRFVFRSSCEYEQKFGYAQMGCGLRVASIAWDNTWRFCPGCGGKMEEQDDAT